MEDFFHIVHYFIAWKLSIFAFKVLFFYVMIKFLMRLNYTSRVQFSSVAQSCPTLCEPMGCSTPGFPVHHQLLELDIPRSNPQRTKSTKINNIKDVLKRELPIQSNRRNSKEWSIPLYEIVFPLLDQHIFFCSTFFFKWVSSSPPKHYYWNLYIMWEKWVIFAQGVKFVRKAIWYLVFLGACRVYPSWVISVTEEDVVTLESIVQVALADLWVGLPTFGAPMAIVFCYCFSSRIYSMLASSSSLDVLMTIFVCSTESVEESLFLAPLLL